jgi:hypothetical protein
VTQSLKLQSSVRGPQGSHCCTQAASRSEQVLQIDGVLGAALVQGAYLSRWRRGILSIPFQGQGTSLALVGAFVLGRELQQTPAEYADPFWHCLLVKYRFVPYEDFRRRFLFLPSTSLVPLTTSRYSAMGNGLPIR